MNIEENEIKPHVEDVQEQKRLEISEEISSHLFTAGKWGKFLAILGFVAMGLMVVGGFIMSIVLMVAPFGDTSAFPFPPIIIGFFYLIIGGVYIFPILYLYRFSTSIQHALYLKSQEKLRHAFLNLKSHYKFIGVFTIVMFALYVIMIIVMVFAGIFSGMQGFQGIAG